MVRPFIDGNCINCAISLSSENQTFNKFTVIEEISCSKSPEQEVAVVDAILCIYGFSVTNLASVYLDEIIRDQNLLACNTTISETSDYIIEHGLYLCSNCVSAFKQLYVASQQLEKWSSNAAILRKAIKKFAPPLIKIEVDPEDFNFEKDDDDEEYWDNNDDNDFKTIQTVEIESLHPENPLHGQTKRLHKKITRPRDRLRKTTSKILKSDNSSEFVSNGLPRTRGAATFLTNENKISGQGSLPTVTVNLVRIEDQKEKKSIPLKLRRRIQNLKKRKERKKQIEVKRKRKAALKMQKEGSSEDDSIAEGCENDSEEKNGEFDETSGSISSAEKSRKLKCSCGKTFSVIASLRKHEKTHESQDPVICVTCGESFEKNYLLYLHKSKDHSELPELLFPCNECGKKFRSKNSLQYHEKSHSKNPESGLSLEEEKKSKILYCSCGKGHRSLRALKKHEKGHVEPLEEVMCDVCGQKFAKSHELYGHKSLEHSEMPHLLKKCKFCDAKFLRSCPRNIHELQHHANERGFICDVCGKSFTCLKYLRKHSDIHKDEGIDKESLKCTKCGIYLKHRLSLKNHMIRMHSTQKTFSCELCGKTTKTMTNMRIHMKVHDPNRTLKTKLLPAPPTIENL